MKFVCDIDALCILLETYVVQKRIDEHARCQIPGYRNREPHAREHPSWIAAYGISSLRVFLVHAHRLWWYVCPFPIYCTSTNTSIFGLGFDDLGLIVGSGLFTATSKDFPLAFVVASKFR